MRAIEAFGLTGCSAVTAITAQGANGIASILCCDPDLVSQQIDSAFQSFDVGAVKIGMLGSAEVVNAVADCLKKHQPKNIVLDPVLVSTSGTKLLNDAGKAALIEKLLPVADVITPNVAELGQLSRMPVDTDAQKISAAKSLKTKPDATVIVTGGDSERTCRDLIVGSHATVPFLDSPPVRTIHSHGTGCLFSTSIAAALAKGCSVSDAIHRAKMIVYWGLQSPIVPMSGRGYPSMSGEFLAREIPARSSSFVSGVQGLYALTDPILNPSRSNDEVVKAALAGGAKIVQLRDKLISGKDLLSEARRLAGLCEDRALFIINDQVDIAERCNADGVHLGPDDMHPREARERLGWTVLIGCSVSTLDEAYAVIPYASYLAVGAIFGSSTKHDAGPAVGVDRIREIKDAFPGIPIVAIGGINLSNISSVAAAGADAAAVVSAIVCADDAEQAARDLLAEFERGKAQRKL